MRVQDGRRFEFQCDAKVINLIEVLHMSSDFANLISICMENPGTQDCTLSVKTNVEEKSLQKTQKSLEGL